METTHAHLLAKLQETIDSHVPDVDAEEPANTHYDSILTNFESRLAVVQDFEPEYPFSFPRSQIDAGVMSQALEEFQASQGFLEMMEILGELEEERDQVGDIKRDDGEEEAPIVIDDPATDDDYSTQASFSSPAADFEIMDLDRRRRSASSPSSSALLRRKGKERATSSSSPTSSALARRKGKERARDISSPVPNDSSDDALDYNREAAGPSRRKSVIVVKEPVEELHKEVSVSSPAASITSFILDEDDELVESSPVREAVTSRKRERSVDYSDFERGVVKRQKVKHYFTESIQELWSCSPPVQKVFEHPVADSPTAMVVAEAAVASGNFISSQDSMDILSPEIFLSKSDDEMFISKSEEEEFFSQGGSQGILQREPSTQLFSLLEDSEVVLVDDVPPVVEKIDMTVIDEESVKVRELPIDEESIIDGGEKYLAAPTFTSRVHFFDLPPSRSDIEAWMLRGKINPVSYSDPFYSDAKDKTRPIIYAGREMRIPVLGEEKLKVVRLGDGDVSFGGASTVIKRGYLLRIAYCRIWNIPEMPPSRRKVVDELKRQTDREKLEIAERLKKQTLENISQIRGPTQAKNPKYMKLNSVASTTDNLVLLAIEIHINTREGLSPDPNLDRIEAVVYCLRHFNPLYKRNGRVFKEGHCGIIMIDDSRVFAQIGIGGYVVTQVGNEGELVRALVDLVHTSDPDVLTGYEVNSASWGYIVQRVSVVDPRFDFLARVSRVKKSDAVTKFGKQNEYGHGI
jgi:hypothetical protein